MCGNPYNVPRKREVFLYIASRLVNLHYGCQCRMNWIKWTMTDFCITFNIGTTTARNMIKRWINNHLKVTDRLKPGKERNLPWQSKETIDMLCSIKVLNEMKTMSLAERVRYIKRTYNITLCQHTLRKYYLNRGVRYKAVDLYMTRKITQANRLQR